MSQATHWSVPLVGPCPPDEFADRIDKSLDALLSSHAGAARPDYAMAGTEWVSTATAGKLKYYVYDGTADRLVKTIDIATGAVTFSNGTVEDALLAKAGGTMSGDIDMDGNDLRNVATFNDGPLASFRNRVINGDFDIWQRGGGGSTSSGYFADDRWNNGHTGSTKNTFQQLHTLGQTAVPGNPVYFSRTVVTSVAGAGNYVVKLQPIEGVKTLSGGVATLTFYAKADAVKNMAVSLDQNFGTGGSPSASVLAIGVTTCALTTAWKRFDVLVSLPSIAGKTLGSNGNDYLGVRFWFDAGSSYNAQTNSLGQQSGTFDISHVSVVAGDARKEADPFSPRHYQQELALCQRYFEKFRSSLTVYQIGGSACGMLLSFKATKRATPTVSIGTIYSSTNASGASYVNTTPFGTEFRTSATVSNPVVADFDTSADAEI